MMSARDKFQRRALIVRLHRARVESRSNRSRAATLRWQKWREDRGRAGLPDRGGDAPRVLECAGDPDADINQLPDSLLGE